MESHDSVDEDDGGGFSAGEDVIADADFLVDEVLSDSFVDAFVASAADDESLFLGEVSDECLVEGLSLRGEEDRLAGRLLLAQGLRRLGTRARVS